MADVSAVDPGFDDIFYHVTSVAGSRSLQPEVVLWIEFIGQMLQDATIEDAKIQKAKKRRHLDGGDSPVLVRDSARAFIFATCGPTATWYNEVCMMADLDPAFVRMVARRAIESGRRIRKDVFSQAVRAPDENPPDESAT